MISPVDETTEDTLNEVAESASVYDMYLPNFSLRSFEGKLKRDSVFFNQNGVGKELIGTCLFLKGNVMSMLPGEYFGVRSYNMSHNFKFDPNNEFQHMSRAGTDIHLIHFSYRPDYFGQFLPENESWADKLRERMGKNECMIGSRFSDISLAQQQALKNVFDCPLTGKMGLMLMETSIIQIILIQMYSLFKDETYCKSQKVSNRDVELIQGLKEYLSKSFLEAHSMMSLSRSFGTNTNKLMTLFKKFFGKSIFEYITELRMDHAKQLLLDNAMTVSEVAKIIGYKNPHHFSTAFKRRFGICPSDFCR